MGSSTWPRLFGAGLVAVVASMFAPAPFEPVLWYGGLLFTGAGVLSLVQWGSGDESSTETPQPSPAAAVIEEAPPAAAPTPPPPSVTEEPPPAEPVAAAAEVTEHTAEDRFRSLVQHTTDIIIVVDDDGLATYQSPSVRRMLGYPEQHLAETSLLEIVHEDRRQQLADSLRTVASGGLGATEHVQARLRHRDGRWRDVDIVCCNLLLDEDVRGVVITGRDVTEREELEGLLRRKAYFDELTEMPNRVLLADRITEALEGPRSAMAVLVVDLDDFRTVNDSLGHGAGDELLQAAGGRVAGCLRPNDTAARLGGDEFGVLLLDCDRSGATVVANRILEAVARPFAVQGHEVRVSASVGIALPSSDSDAHVLLRSADTATFDAKRRGKARHAIFEQGMHTRAVRRLELKAEMERGLERGEFLLHYQPIVEMLTGRIVGCEALARWMKPGVGLVPPTEFIPLAEETGLIVRLGQLLLREACAQLVQWQRLPGQERLYISVNFAARQLEEPGVIDMVAQAMGAVGIDPAHLVVELTESAIAPGTDATLRGLKDLGLSVAIDDFGTGYSNLSYLQRMPLDIVKIDKSFVDAIQPDGTGEIPLLSGIIELATSLGARTIAEGIETDAQVPALLELGSGLGQGYLYSPPRASDAFEDLLVTWRPLVPTQRVAEPQA